MGQSLLDEFIVFSRYLSFTNAAEELHMTESALSKHMQRLERDLGIKLIARGRQVALTPAGDYFLRNIYALTERYESIVDACRAQSGEDA